MGNTPVNLNHLKEKLVESEYIKKDFDLTLDSLKDLLNKRFESINFEDAKDDVRSFIRNTDELKLWNKEFFKEITKQLV